jgi:hypothetical protein
MEMDPKYQAAYEQFMLGGKQKKQQQTAQKSPFGRTAIVSDKSKHYDHQKDIHAIFKSFQSCVNDWIDNDQHALKVLESISHLRERILWETKEISNSTTSPQLDCASNDLLRWRDHGFRSTVSSSSSAMRSWVAAGCLSLSDIELALDHDLLQHERMMAGLRGVVATMAQNLDAIGRRLDEWMVAQQEKQFHSHHAKDHLKWSSTLDSAQHLFVALSEDLLWKQKAVERIVQSYHDGLLYVDSHTSNSSAPSVAVSTGKTFVDQLHESPHQVVRKVTADFRMRCAYKDSFVLRTF